MDRIFTIHPLTCIICVIITRGFHYRFLFSENPSADFTTAALASIVLELKNLEYKNHSYALLLLCQFFPSCFTSHVYKTNHVKKFGVKRICCTVNLYTTRGFGGKAKLRHTRHKIVRHSWILICLKTYETLESDLFFPFQSLMSICIDTTLL